MNFDNTPPKWNNTGEEPTDYLKQNGFMPGYKPAAKIFNWFFALVGKCISEIQTKLNEVEEGAQKNTVTGIKGDAESSYRTGNINLTKNNIGLGNVPNVSTNNQTPTYSKSPILATLSSGENLSASFGKMKSIFDSVVPYEITGTISNDILLLYSYAPTEGLYFIKKTTSSTANAASILKYDSDTWTIINRNEEASEIYSNKSYVVYITSEVDTDESVNGKCMILSESTADTVKSCIFGCISELFSTKMERLFNSNGFTTMDEITQVLNNKSKNATVVIGTSTSGHTTDDVDYLCNGISDQEEINNAIAALPEGGGKIVLLEGTYNLSSRINLDKANMTIEGMGNGTVLVRNFNDASYANNGLIKVTAANCCVEKLCVNGNIATCSGSGNAGISVAGVSQCTVKSVRVVDECRGVYFCGGASKNVAIDVHTENVKYGAMLYYAQQNTVIGCTFNGGSDGVRFEYQASRNIISQNQITSPTEAGIYISGDCPNEIISNNVIVKGSDTQYTIYVAGKYNVVVDNQLPNMTYTDASGGSTNTFENNM